MTATQMATAKNRHTEIIKKTRLSTWGAKLEACSGYNGICDCTINQLLDGSNSHWHGVCHACGKSQSSAAARQQLRRPASAYSPELLRCIGRWMDRIGSRR